MDQSQFGNLGATLVDLGNNFATVESDIMNMSLRLAAAGHQVGLTEQRCIRDSHCSTCSTTNPTRR